MKYQQLKKRLLVESGVLAAVAIALGGGLYLLSNFSDAYLKDSEALEAKVNEAAAAANTLRAKFDKVQKNEALYKTILELQATDGLNITQQTAKNTFNHFRDQYYLSNLHLSMSPVTPVKGADYQRSTHVIASSDVDIDFDGLSDEYVYDLLDAMQHELPGSSKITKMTLTRQGAITNDALRAISENGTFPLIKGDIKFTWFGINPVESNDSSANASKNSH